MPRLYTGMSPRFLAFTLSLAVVGPHTLWGLVGLVPLLTGFVGSCPLYTLLGLRTNGATSNA
jgi:hypothetical protein